MQLMTQAIRALLPKLRSGSTRDNCDADKIPLKLFDPAGRMTYYVTEFDGEDILFGFMVSPLGPDCDEWGYSSLSELQATKNRFGLGIERDRHWNPETTVADLLRQGVL